MPCKVVGSGIAGLAVALFLQRKGIKVTIYSSKNKRAASDIYAGMLYRYPGRWGKKSKYADEAFLAAEALLHEVEERTGRKVIISKGVLKKFSPRLKKFSDVEMIGEDAWIKEGYTVNVREYREGLKELVGKENFVEEEVQDLSCLDGWKVVATGHGAKELLPNLPLKFLKGQQFLAEQKAASTDYGSVVGRGHVSFLEDGRACFGSSYEKEFATSKEEPEVAVAEISAKIEPWFGSMQELGEKEFFAAVRAAQTESYLPLVDEVAEKTLVFVGLGSRGLLYHAYYGKIVADRVELGHGK